MSNNAKKRRIDDNEKRSKPELVNEISQSELRLRNREAHMLNELTSHQFALEMQNFDLRKAQEQLEEARDRYADLYDFSPVGYLTLDENGCVLETNLTATLLLGQDRANVIGKPFANWLAPGEAGPFLVHMYQALSSANNVVIETKIMAAGKLRDIRLESSTSHDGPGKSRSCRTVMTDITLSRQTEKRTKELLQENRRLTRRLFSVQELERRHLSRELHDELGQWLTAIQADAQAIYCVSSKKTDACATCQDSAQAITSSANQIHQMVRRMLRRLRPVVLDQLGLADSLEEMVCQWRTHHPEIYCELTLEGDLNDLNEVTNITLYRTIQAALTNISSHAGASQVSVSLHREPDHILLSVADNGQGMNMHLPSLGLGLLGMRERAIAAEGEFSFTSKPGQGMRIDVKLPLTQSGQEK
jgi:PAS domain S-box-containing protein